MNPELQSFLARTKLGEAKSYKHITVVPLLGPTNGEPDYLTLEEALQSGQLLVTEVSQGGAVPELKVINRLPRPVLLLDGEELLGAKQNRVLNTTILLKESSETVVPVSCTEQGRWAYVSAAFHSSNVLMAQKIRSQKARSVSRSLEAHAHFHSDQGEVWNQIHQLHAKAGTHSPTGAMHDAFVQRQAELENCLQALPLGPNQNGLLVLIGGEVAGFDLVSRPQAYAKLHAKLLKSYVLEALLEPKSVQTDPGQARDRAQDFLEEVQQSEESRFPSPGYGADLRFQQPRVTGTALVHDRHVVHTAFFRVQPAGERGRMAPLHRRRQRLGN